MHGASALMCPSCMDAIAKYAALFGKYFGKRRKRIETKKGEEEILIDETAGAHKRERREREDKKKKYVFLLIPNAVIASCFCSLGVCTVHTAGRHKHKATLKSCLKERVIYDNSVYQFI